MNKRNHDSFLDQKKCLKPYLETFIDQIEVSGDVLDIGFALGYTADRIQFHKPKSHTIIEPDAAIAEKAIVWAKSHPTVTIIQDTWEKALPKLGIFDHIILDDFCPDIDATHDHSCEPGNFLVKQGRELNAMVNELIPDLTGIKYSDSDIETFFNKIGEGHKSELSYFLQELKGNGQISPEQYEKAVSKYKLDIENGKISNKVKKRVNPSFQLLQDCLERHMRKGSCFSCFSSCGISKFEIPEFFEVIVTNPYIDYQEKIFTVEDPHCSAKVLISIVEKLRD